MQKALAQYLNKYAEPEAGEVSELLQPQFQYCLILPVYKESSELVLRLKKQLQGHSVLVVLVVNQPDSDVDEQPQQALWQAIVRQFHMLDVAENLHLLLVPESQSGILMVDRFSVGRRIPAKQGVGLARKIAMDCALAAIASGKVACSSIYSTDADTDLPENYFSTFHLNRGDSAGVFRFNHAARGDSEVDSATKLYEQRLHHYVLGLQYAASPYAFHTIGSCLLVDALAYCQVRGFPKKAAGEDFYLLNKLAKLGKVQALSPQLTIQSRISDRVPFGTGPAVQEIVQQQLAEETYPVYHPHIFVHLKTLLRAFESLTPDALASLNEAYFESISQDYLKQAGFWQTCKKWQKQGYSQAQLQKALTDWFDGFRTLKYVHFLRGSDYPDIPLKQALQIRARLGF